MPIENHTKEYLKTRFSHVSDFEREKISQDWKVKERIGRKVFVDFKERVGDPAGKRVLDVGFGNGLMMKAFGEGEADIYGVEVDPVLKDIAIKTLAGSVSEEKLSLYDGVHFPYKDNFFDFLIATSVLEHVSNPVTFLSDAARILKPKGKFYLSFPNRWYPKETHTGVWFLSFVPRPIALFVMRTLFRRSTMDDWNLHFLSYFSFVRMLQKNKLPFRILFETSKGTPLKRVIKEVLVKMGIHHSALLRTIMLVLEKQ